MYFCFSCKVLLLKFDAKLRYHSHRMAVFLLFLLFFLCFASGVLDEYIILWFIVQSL
ncbi:hypothetical protein HMPREF0653_00478 [Prevotella disiens JCM 6334 = ATCC 29426]|uniref:Uncharacterized protein n=1 Tax=Prevotella disiens JCM 6334 = ATCC 29426 TaxID=1235811 RepID=A0ABN0NUI1_9BACT|nr:hypothetical protein HMPREF0653_00478 [Prevotella disiens JCM 6334 = ATCC 29426]